MDPMPLPEGYTLLEAVERCLLAAEGYRELGLFDEAQRELDGQGAGTRAQWHAMSATERELRTRWAAERMPSPEKVFGAGSAPTP